MHRFHIVLLFLFTQAVFAQLPQLGKTAVNEVVKKITLEEKAELLVGTGMPGYGSEDEVGANKVSDVATQINAGNDWLMPGTPQQITAVIQQKKKEN